MTSSTAKAPFSSGSGGATDRIASWSEKRRRPPSTSRRSSVSVRTRSRPSTSHSRIDSWSATPTTLRAQSKSCSVIVTRLLVRCPTSSPCVRSAASEATSHPGCPAAGATRSLGRLGFALWKSSARINPMRAGFAGVPRKPHRPAYNVQPPSAAARAATVAIVEVEDPVAQASEKCHDVCIHRVRQNEQIRPGRLRLVTTEAHADEHAGQLERLQRCIDLVGMILCQLPNCVAHDFPEPLCQVFIKALGRERHDQPIDYFEAGLALLLLQERVAA
eukprot:scaffold18316_cov119-Isochrysis_galbana.AAC.2